ncbi:MAG: ThiF family adenylyltransferase, partial [Clostridia bacterium]|nr:ThiF family adenylyltransferase [Clostridia bacterium]
NILKINPKAQVTTFSVFADETNIDQILKDKPDAVIDAIDSVQSKCFLLEYCLKNNIKVFSSMGAALKTDPLKIKTADLMDTIRLIRDKFDVTILLIEHDMKFVSGLCDELTVLNFGTVLAQGETKAALNDPEVIKAYTGG